ncbi:TetR/AcrR family transcriptional regulator [Erythrobacter ani]|uniref:TetR/AcrR family transcriptional regulator n=1 Tax=Erythrobacter ani TaxID=2827235 RepID=A0ABS6SM01_9SPHN|nr:TetR/AcrR family transcriptional regulator [Erythrobacter ani]MBV7266073.1 TetR/AcrR family transcriptional regulator [Erythrobacter ani]
MANAKKQSFHHGNLREAILEASLEILDEDGADAITIREVARRTGVSHAAPVNHFKDREALLTEVALGLYAELSQAVSEKIDEGSGSGLERVEAFAFALISYGIARPHRYRMLWRHDLIDTKDRRLAMLADGLYDRLVEEIGVARSDGDFDNHTVAIGLWSMAHGYVSLRLDGNFEAARDEMSGETRQEAIVRAFLRSLN